MKPYFKSDISAAVYAFFRSVFVTCLFLYVPFVAWFTLLYEHSFLSASYNIYFTLCLVCGLPFLFVFFTAGQFVHYFVCRKSLSGTLSTVTFLHQFAAVMSLIFIVVYVFFFDEVTDYIGLLVFIFPVVSIIHLICAYILLKVHMLIGNVRINEEYLTQAAQFRQVKLITSIAVVCIFALVFLLTLITR